MSKKLHPSWTSNKQEEEEPEALLYSILFQVHKKFTVLT